MVEDDEDEEVCFGYGGIDGVGFRLRLMYKMYRFSLYEIVSCFYIVGGDVIEKCYCIFKIDRINDDELELSIIDDKIVYIQKDMNELLDMIDDGNKGMGGLKF